MEYQEVTYLHGSERVRVPFVVGKLDLEDVRRERFDGGTYLPSLQTKFRKILCESNDVEKLNGTCHGLMRKRLEYVARYQPGEIFVPPHDPGTSDARLAGWPDHFEVQEKPLSISVFA